MSNSMELGLLRLSVIGNVDDGKSTLIGRMLFDTKNILEDQMTAIESASKRRGELSLNLALLADGLKAEREQGITIDVAYKYFSTLKRKFIIADCPGHHQYTRNMVTGTSTAQASILLIDARAGLQEQTRRHALICSMMRVPHLVVCVNKMDLVSYSQDVFEKIRSELETLLREMEFESIHFLPISALKGDTVVENSKEMPWYSGPDLLSLLETLPLKVYQKTPFARFPVQRVIRPMKGELHDFRGYAGRLECGTLTEGDEVTIFPSGITSRIKSIYWKETRITEAQEGMSIVLTLEREVDLSRGGWIVNVNSPPLTGNELDLIVCWFSEKPMQNDGNYIIRLATSEVRAKIVRSDFKYDINTFEKVPIEADVSMNDLARIRIRCAQDFPYDTYEMNKSTGGLILVDPISNNTVASGIVVS